MWIRDRVRCFDGPRDDAGVTGYDIPAGLTDRNAALRTRTSTCRRSTAASSVTCTPAPASAENDVLGGSTKLFVDSQSSTNLAARHLWGQAKRDAQLLGQYPGATWFSDCLLYT